MTEDDEQDGEPSPDIPTFEDLVEEVEQRQDSTKEAKSNTSNDSTSSHRTDEESTHTDSEKPHLSSGEEEWDWVDTDTSDGHSEAPEDEQGVDALWEEQSTSRDAEVVDWNTSSKDEALFELVHEASNILLLGPSGIPRSHELCSKLTDVQAGNTRRRILVTTNQTADERLESLSPFTDEPYEETILIEVGDQVRSSDGKEPSTVELNGETVVIETLTNPRDLTRLGILINKYLNQEETTKVLCFNSLNEILQYVGVEKLFRFIHILQGRVRSIDAHAHYQLDPQSLDEQSISTLKSLFDFTVSYDVDGSLSVEPRK